MPLIPTIRLVWRLESPQMGYYLGNRYDVGILGRHVVEIGEMWALLLVGDALLGNDRALSLRDQIDAFEKTYERKVSWL